MAGETNYTIAAQTATQGDIIAKAVEVAGAGCNDINLVLDDIKADSKLSASLFSSGTALTGLDSYGVKLTNDLPISSAAGAMVVDDLMQKISTKVQVAAQMLAAANNANKAATRIMSQG
jgi:hypothetical protein